MSKLLRVFIYDMAGNTLEVHVPGDATVYEIKGAIKGHKGVRRLRQQLYSIGTETVWGDRTRLCTLVEWVLGDLIPDPEAQGLPPCPRDDVHLQLAVMDLAPDCGYCERPAKRMCEGCRRLLYCNRVCQARHWPTHRRECQRASLTPVSDLSKPSG